MAARRRLELYLTDTENQFQKVVTADARRAAHAAGYEVAVFSAEQDPARQLHQIYTCIHRPEAERPRAILVNAVTQGSLQRAFRDAARVGIASVLLNRTEEHLDELRAAFPAVPIFAVTPDQREIGLIQARQALRLLPEGGRVLLVQGVPESSAARQRLAAFREGIGDAPIELNVGVGRWSKDAAWQVTLEWLRQTAFKGREPRAIVCQSDLMAQGAVEALRAFAREAGSRRPGIPVTGCGVVASAGRALVDRGVLAATVRMPSTGEVAVKLLVRSLRSGKQPPAETLLAPSPYPA
jgi:ribose transport system substrate-binding protein